MQGCYFGLGGQRFPPATRSMTPGYFHGEIKKGGRTKRTSYLETTYTWAELFKAGLITQGSAKFNSARFESLKSKFSLILFAYNMNYSIII